ncbi:MAG: matrixin family metalloprotease [Patescibacteria group bacterium]|nr:matrixin family metalloprotease [Patescibacteria group bacterium]MDE2116585.1 matrixin family metalloprotease [Patescibacteria group bacterium]
MSLFKRSFVVIGILGATAAGFAGGQLVYEEINPAPCSSPLTYKLGAFDPRFGISKADFVADMKEAADIWSTALAPDGSRPLLAYEPNGTIPVNLVFDSRQAMVDTAASLAAGVDQTKATAASLIQEIDSLKSEYSASDAEYQRLAGQFQQALQNYNAEVSYWNARGGAPASQYARIQGDRSALDQLQNQADTAMIRTNDLVRQINSLVDQYNALASKANSVVSKINQTAGQQFEEGEYVSDSQGQRIDIYEFDSKTKLVRLLAHEMGHALGLDHNSDPQSIMYYLNQANTLTLSPEDIASIKAVCGVKN